MKNQIKRITVLILALSLLMCGAVSAEDIKIPYEVSGSAEFSLLNPITNLTVGDAVYVKVNVNSEDTNGLYGYELELSFDSGYLTYSSAEPGIDGEYITAKSDDSGRVKLAFCKSADDSTVGTELATVKFISKASGTTSVKLTNAVLINDDMSYTEYSLSKSIGITVSAKTAASASSGGGGGSVGGFGGGFATGGGSNTVTAVSPVIEPADLTVPAEESEIFSDLSEADWAVSAITSLYNLGILDGYEDGSFKPNSNITRAEFCKVIVNAMGIPLTEDSLGINFVDADEYEWYSPYIKAAAQLNIINGYEDGTFKPDQNINRQEAAAVVCRTIDGLGLNINSSRLNINFDDEADIEEFAVGYVDKLYTAEILNGDDNNCFRPLDSLSRAEAAQIVQNLLNALNPEPITDEVQEPLAARMAYAAEDLSDEAEAEPDTEPTDEPAEEPAQEPTEEPTQEPTAEPTEEPTEEPNVTYEPDAVYDCDSLAELYSYSNVYAYLIPDDGSRQAFYGDYTTFQRPSDGEAYIIYEIPYAEQAEVVTYFYAGEPLVDFAYQISSDGEYWTDIDFDCDYLEADGKWTRAVYQLSDLGDTRYIKIIFPQTVNWWTPLVSSVSAAVGEPEAVGIKLIGDDILIIPRYDFVEYRFSAYLVDQIGERFEGDVTLSIKDSDITDLSISEDGIVIIDSESADGAEFTVYAESAEYGLSAQMSVALTAAQAGDLNNDGAVDKSDLELVLTYYDKNSADYDWNSVRDGDINKDGIINIVDIAYIAKKAGDVIE